MTRQLLTLLGVFASVAATASSSIAQSSASQEPYPAAPSKKGLQVQMVDDAIALGIRHAALNVDIANLIKPRPEPMDLIWRMEGVDYAFKKGVVHSLDAQVKPLSDAGVIVSFILLAYQNADPEVNALMLHPNYDPKCPNRLAAFNTSTESGINHFKACIQFLAARYSGSNAPHGKAWNFIVGNEVNSHWFWYNRGRTTMENVADDYLKAVRLCHGAVRKASANMRVFISLEHHWGIRYPGGSEDQAFAGKNFLDYFARRAKEGGDFDWAIAYHPYPENLFECRTWNDKSAVNDFNSPRITFKNLEVLPRYLSQERLLYDGKPRRIILSEQGFHSGPGERDELNQAAAYCYAYYKVSRMPSIDSFILHRHVDHGHEGGLNLGLWRRDPKNSFPATPLAKKKIYEVFKAADTPAWESAFEFALPIIGIRKWQEVVDPR
jgi:hypothetical protein